MGRSQLAQVGDAPNLTRSPRRTRNLRETVCALCAAIVDIATQLEGDALEWFLHEMQTAVDDAEGVAWRR